MTHYLEGNNNPMTTGCSSETMEGRIKWNNKVLGKNKPKQTKKPTLQPRAQNPGKIFFISEAEITTLSVREGKQRECIASRPVLKNC